VQGTETIDPALGEFGEVVKRREVLVKQADSAARDLIPQGVELGVFGLPIRAEPVGGDGLDAPSGQEGDAGERKAAAADGFDLRIGQILIECGNLNGRGKNLAAGLRSCRYHAWRASLLPETGISTHLIGKAGPLLSVPWAILGLILMPLGEEPENISPESS